MFESVCALLHFVSLEAHILLMPPPQLKDPKRAVAFTYGRLTFLTVQSNLVCFVYYASSMVAPSSELLWRVHPIVFALGFALTPLYYGLDHFTPEKKRIDAKMRKGYPYVDYGNHLEHALALPAALLHAVSTPRAAPASSDVLVFCGGYGIAYFILVLLLGKWRGNAWVYPVCDELERDLGPMGPYLLGLVVTLAFVALGFADQLLLSGSSS